MVQEKLKELVGKNAPAFATSVLQIVNSNSMLVNADPQTIFSAACMAATLNLPINNNLGFAYIVPLKTTRKTRLKLNFNSVTKAIFSWRNALVSSVALLQRQFITGN